MCGWSQCNPQSISYCVFPQGSADGLVLDDEYVLPSTLPNSTFDIRDWVVGQSLFADVDGDKVIDHMVPVCKVENSKWVLFENSQVAIIDGASHWVAQDKPKEVVAAMNKFLS